MATYTQRYAMRRFRRFNAPDTRRAESTGGFTFTWDGESVIGTESTRVVSFRTSVSQHFIRIQVLVFRLTTRRRLGREVFNR